MMTTATWSRSLPTTLPAYATAYEATVTINVVDEDEKPTFGDVITTATPPANVTAAVVVENAPVADLNFASYTATDPDARER